MLRYSVMLLRYSAQIENKSVDNEWITDCLKSFVVSSQELFSTTCLKGV